MSASRAHVRALTASFARWLRSLRYLARRASLAQFRNGVRDVPICLQATARCLRRGAGPFRAAAARSNPKVSIVEASDVLSARDVHLPAPMPGSTLETTPNYQAVDPPMTAERFSREIEPVKTVPWAWDWDSQDQPAESDRAEGAGSTPSRSGGVRPGRSGVISPSEALASGTRVSVMGVPNAATLVHSTIMAAKEYNGKQYQALCQFEIWTGTPRATRTIEIGTSWNCNQPWIRGGIAVTGAGTNRPDGTISESALQRPDGSYVNRLVSIDGSLLNRTYAWSTLYDRTFEHQLEHLYGYVDLYVDGSAGPNDSFFGQPSAEGAYSSYRCNQALKPSVTCEWISDPFAFIPDESTQCVNGACAPPQQEDTGIGPKSCSGGQTTVAAPQGAAAGQAYRGGTAAANQAPALPESAADNAGRVASESLPELDAREDLTSTPDDPDMDPDSCSIAGSQVIEVSVCTLAKPGPPGLTGAAGDRITIGATAYCPTKASISANLKVCLLKKDVRFSNWLGLPVVFWVKKGCDDRTVRGPELAAFDMYTTIRCNGRYGMRQYKTQATLRVQNTDALDNDISRNKRSVETTLDCRVL